MRGGPVGLTDSSGLLLDAAALAQGSAAVQSGVPAAAAASGVTAGVAAAAIGGAAVGGAVVGTIINNALDDLNEEPIGETIYNWSHPETGSCQLSEGQRIHDHKEYKRICSKPPPPHLAKGSCERARWLLIRARTCFAMRSAYSGNYNKDQVNTLSQVEREIGNAQSLVDESCK